MTQAHVRGRIEAGFTRWGAFVVRRCWLVIAACAALTAVLVARLPELRVDNSDEAFLHADNPARKLYDQFQDQFDREDRVLVVLRPPAIFEKGFLETLRRLHREIEREVPYVEDVTSLVNARHTYGEGDELVVEDLMEVWPESEADIALVRERVRANPLYQGVLISDDETYTVVSIKPFTYSTQVPDGDALAGFEAGGSGEPRPMYLTEAEGTALVEKLEAVVARYASTGLEAHMVGGPTFDRQLTTALQHDVSIFMSLSLVAIVVLLYVLFRRVSGVVLPTIVVLSAMLSAMGFMVWLDIPFSITLNMLPAFLLVVGVCDSIHILTLVYRQMAAGSPRHAAIVYAIGHSGLAVVMTSVTTAAGLLSFSVAELAPIAQLGVIAPAGVMLALFYSIALLPAMLAVVPLRPETAVRGARLRASLDRVLVAAGDFSTRRPWSVVGVTAAILAVALPGVMRVRFSHDGMRWFPEHDPLRVALGVVNDRFGGASSLEVVVRTGEENGLYDPETLRRIEGAMRHSETLEVSGRRVSKATSIVDVIKETNQALNENRPEFYRLPQERGLVAQELLLFENSGSDDLEDVTDSLFETARVSIRTPWVDAMLYTDFLDEVRRDLRERLDGSATFELTGGAVLFTSVFRGVIISMARSYVFALAVITPLMVLLIGNLRRGLLAMIPNLIPVYLVLALMGWTGIPLDASTLLIGGVIIGLAVDDTIHFMHKFGRYYEDTGDPHHAVHQTLATTGRAMLFTSLVLTLGFAVLLAAYMRNSFWFGLLAGTATIVAFLADILLGPALMVLATARRPAPAPAAAVA